MQDPHLRARGYFAGAMREEHITVKEMAAVRYAVSAMLPELQQRTVHLHCDAMVVVHALQQMVCRSPALRRELRQLYDVLDSNAVVLKVSHVAGVLNDVADGLSRHLDRDDWALNPALFRHFNAKWGPVTVDRFASSTNCQVPAFWSEMLCPNSLGVNSLSAMDWSSGVSWCNPPFRLLDDLVGLLRRCHSVHALVVAPLWKSASWYAPLLAMSEEVEVLQPQHDLFFPGDLGSSQAVGPPPWPIMVVLVRKGSCPCRG